MKMFTLKKLFIVLAVAVLWIVAGIVLYDLVGADNGPHGGLDSLASAFVYVFIWELFIYIPPLLMVVVSFFVWLYQNHRHAVRWVIVGIVVCSLCAAIYMKFIRRILCTPERVADQIEIYDDWKQDYHKYGSVIEGWTESDDICEYAERIVMEAVSKARYRNPEIDEEVKRKYIDAAMQEHYKEMPHVTGWEYIPDVMAILQQCETGDSYYSPEAASEGFLMNNDELRAIGLYFNRELNRDHWYDRYEFEREVIAEWYSWLPMMAIFYDDGTMDLVIANG